jgi:hypothetical protein
MPVSQMPAQIPEEYGAQTEPGAKPNASQSASVLQSAHSLGLSSETHALLSPVVRIQAQRPALLHNVCCPLIEAQ